MKTELAAALTKHATNKGIRYYESLIRVDDTRAVWSDATILLSCPASPGQDAGNYDAVDAKARSKAAKALKADTIELTPKGGTYPPYKAIFAKERKDIGVLGIHKLKQAVDFMAAAAGEDKVLLQQTDGQLWITDNKGVESCVCFCLLP
jgi:hypothetical protein